jgi:hypothetical protein
MSCNQWHPPQEDLQDAEVAAQPTPVAALDGDCATPLSGADMVGPTEFNCMLRLVFIC